MIGHVWHLARRFFGSLVPVGPSSTDIDWVEQQLLPAEVVLWQRMDRADRRHSVGVARRTRSILGPDTSRPVLAAGLLHDVGKVASGLGTYRRVIATVVVRGAGRDRAVGWGQEDGFRGQVGRYADHARIGGDLLADAGSDPLTVAWAREHHLPERLWTVPGPVGDALKAADDD